MRKKLTVSAVLIVALISVLLASCGPTATPVPIATEVPPTPTSPPPTPTAIPPTPTPVPPTPTTAPGASPLPAPGGDVILKVSGDLTLPNAGDECHLDADLFDQYAEEQTLDDPWMGDGLEYRGLTLDMVWTLCGGSDEAGAMVMVAKDGMTLEVAAEDLKAWPIMLAYQVGGEDLIDDLGGPVKLVFPAEAADTYSQDYWMWWVAEVQIGEATAAGPLPAPGGDVILKVTGDLSLPNVDEECHFDADLFDQHAISQDLDDPWMGDGLEYRGLTLDRVWTLCGGSDEAEAMVMVAKDGMTVEVAAEDLKAWPIMLAYQVDGEDLVDEVGGPVKLVFPAEAADTYSQDYWMWWVAGVQIGKEAEAEALPAPSGDVILKVTGGLTLPNVDDECHLDADLFDQYAEEQTLDDPWMGDGLEYRGLTLDKVWTLCGGSDEAEAMVMVAKDGMTVEVAAEDLKAWPIMLAYQVGGKDLVDDLGGPVKLVFPAEAADTYSQDYWMWWVAEVQIGEATAAGPLPAPGGDVILKVTGDLSLPNVDEECHFDADLFDQHAISQDLDDPWMGDGLEYRGLTLDKVWRLCGGSDEAEAMVMVAKDGMTIEVAAEDLKAWPIMLAYQVDGEDLIDEVGGPVKLVFPAEAADTYSDDVWMWWVVEVQFK